MRFVTQHVLGHIVRAAVTWLVLLFQKTANLQASFHLEMAFHEPLPSHEFECYVRKAIWGSNSEHSAHIPGFKL
jgi:hypothetical protein